MSDSINTILKERKMRAIDEIELCRLAVAAEREITHEKHRQVLDAIIVAGYSSSDIDLFLIDFEKDKQRTLDRYLKIFKRG